MRAFALTLIGALALILAGPAAFAANPPAASGPLTGVVDEGVVAPTPIATPAFNGADPASQALGDQIAQVVAADLERSGYFAPIDRNAYIDKNLDINIQPRFDDWKKINAQALINGQAAIESDGRIRVDFRLWDVFSEQALLGVQLTATQDNWRRVAHKIADAVYSRLTGNGAYFDTRIVFVAESGARGHRVKRLEIMDQDGANPSFPPTGGETILTPRFSSNSQKIVYMALTESATNIYVLDLETGRRESLGEFKGVVFAPRFSPDGLKVAFSISQYGNTDIYTIDLRTREIKRLTVDPSIDTSPCFTPDGGTIIFNSDRSGQPQIYAMNADGGNVRRISFGSGRYHTPVVSPKGDLIAFTKQEGNRFSIGVMKLDGTGEKLLSSSFAQEGPTWAPNGRYLMFFREPVGGSPRLWTIDVTGRVERPAPYPGAASDPSWSALLN